MIQFQLLQHACVEHFGLVWMAPWPGLACQAINRSPSRSKSNAWDAAWQSASKQPHVLATGGVMIEFGHNIMP